MRTLVIFLHWIERPMKLCTEVCFICFIDKFLFLKNYTEEQKRKIQILFCILLIPSIISAILCFAADYDFITFYASIICDVIFLLTVVALVLYSNMAGRKKAKWLGIFFVIPLMGYSVMMDCVYDTVKLLPISKYGISLICIVVDIFLLLGMIYLSYEKTKPDFIRKFENDIKNMNYSVMEAAGIWLIGGLLVIYELLTGFKVGIFKDMTQGVDIFVGFLICAFGMVVTFFIINSSYRRYYYEKNLKYQKTLITTMANLVESRDDNTGGHIHRTAKYVEIIAKKLQSGNKFKEILTDKYIDDMVIAAPLHDVGKIHISDVVLNKPGKLDAEEFAMMKTHSAAGGEIINQVEEEVGEDISYLDIAKDMAEYHHERMDGKGYPHGISGEEIPLCARILAVADVFDALISKRCYKDAMPLDKAFAIIKEETGDHFDEEIANAFLASRDEVEQFLSDIAEEEKTGNVAEVTN